jgi:hypothetical protein
LVVQDLPLVAVRSPFRPCLIYLHQDQAAAARYGAAHLVPLLQEEFVLEML